MSEPIGTPDTEPGLGAQLVLNALRDVIVGRTIVIEDDRSRDLIEDAYTTAVNEADREEVAKAITAAQDGEDEGTDGLSAAVKAVVDELAQRGIEARLTHRFDVEIEPEQAALFNAIRSTETDLLETIDLSDAVLNDVLVGVNALGAEEYDRATGAFEQALDRDGHDGFVPHILAGWARQQAGDDAEALAHAEVAAEREGDSWAGRMVSVAAEAASPELFRDGTHDIGAYLRVRAETPEATRIRAAISTPDEAGQNGPEWTELPGSIAFFDIDRLGPKTSIRLELTGPIESMPVIHAYYLAMGVVDRRNSVPRSVEHLFLTGPETAETTERIRFRRSGEP